MIQLLAEGKSSKEVATLLNLSTKTAETHRSNIMRKLGFHSIRDLVLYAVKNDIIQVHMPPEGRARDEVSTVGDVSCFGCDEKKKAARIWLPGGA